jgi:hypothetical protein
VGSECQIRSTRALEGGYQSRRSPRDPKANEFVTSKLTPSSCYLATLAPLGIGDTMSYTGFRFLARDDGMSRKLLEPHIMQVALK